MKAITLVLAVALVVAGCSAAPSTVGTRNPAAVQPLPANATEVTKLPVPSVDTSCGDPKASYRPDGPPPAPGDFPSDSMMATILQRGWLVVGVDQNTYRFAYRDSQSGKIEGFALDIAQQIAKAIFGDGSRIKLVVLTSSQRIPAVKNGDVDLVVHSMTANCERWKDVDFSTTFYNSEQKVLVRKSSGYSDLTSLAGRKVCATKDSTSLARIVNLDKVKGVTPKPVGVQVAGWTDCLVMLQQTQVYAVSTDDTILAGLADQDPFTVVSKDGIAPEPYGIAIHKDHRDFVKFVNAVLEKIKADGTWTNSYNHWLRPLLNVDATPPVAQYKD
jgi:polar amino acid transport system substrate-binding protein